MASSAERPELGIAIVPYRIHYFLRDCLASVYASRGVRLAVSVVDLDSRDGTVEMVRREFPAVILVEPGENVGYSRGNNLALRRLAELSNPPRHYLLLNGDTRVPPDALRRLLDLLEAYPSIGACGPRLALPDGRIDWACRRGFPTPRTSLFHMAGLSRLFPRSRLFGRYRLTFLDERSTADVDSVVGAFMLIRGEALAAAGPLDESYFMYGEDLDLARRIRAAGWRVVYDGRVDVLHHKRASTRQNPRVRVEFYRSMRIFFRKHYAPITPGPVRFVVEAAISVLMAITSLRLSRASA